MIEAVFLRESIITENSDEARELYVQSRFGHILQDGRVELSTLEAAYLLDKKKVRIIDGRGKSVDMARFVRKAVRFDANFRVRYRVFHDLRKRGYIVKTALKFGADFRVYDRGVKPGEDHARWIVYPVHESEALTWYEFAAKNRVAHSTKKRLLLGVVDAEGDVSYWEVRWLRP
ncbi:tRNA-intron lyase [Candidatus Woesearchaeota archaeon]|nr:tRNA-intron lyase [Candidatus Woesearchaeota archaeon]